MVELGERYGQLVVFEEGEPLEKIYDGKISRARRWRCRCDCGNETLSWQSELKRGRTVSCGHGRKAALLASVKTHGQSHSPEGRSSEYSTWSNMLSRCNNNKTDFFKDYGGRGISVCERWHRFENFFADMGVKPTRNHTIERDDVNGNYELGNCRWEPKNRQARNRRNTIWVTVDSQKLCLAEASRVLGINYATVRHRVKRGMTPCQALGINDGH